MVTYLFLALFCALMKVLDVVMPQSLFQQPSGSGGGIPSSKQPYWVWLECIHSSFSLPKAVDSSHEVFKVISLNQKFLFNSFQFSVRTLSQIFLWMLWNLCSAGHQKICWRCLLSLSLLHAWEPWATEGTCAIALAQMEKTAESELSHLYGAFQRLGWVSRRLKDVTKTSQINLSFGFVYIRKCWLFLYRNIVDNFFNL